MPYRSALCVVLGALLLGPSSFASAHAIGSTVEDGGADRHAAGGRRALGVSKSAVAASNPQMTVDTGITPLSFRYVGSTGVSAQQMIMGTSTTLYIVDKTQRNDNFTVGGHPAWAAELNLLDMSLRPLDIITNAFCAGGGYTGNGSLVNIGGNNAVGLAGITSGTGSGTDIKEIYGDLAGGKILRTMDPCVDGSCVWNEWDDMTINRWYPSVETLANGTVLVIGGELYGGYTNTKNQAQNNPTVQVWPNLNGGRTGTNVFSTFLNNTQPLNLYAISFLLPSGQIFMNAGLQNTLYDPTTLVETALPPLPAVIRVYPASGASAMLPLTPANNYTASILMCGGVAAPDTDTAWDNTLTDVTKYVGSNVCDKMVVNGASSTWVTDDPMPEGRILNQFIGLPDGTLLMLNGAAKGTAGYGWDASAKYGLTGQGYASSPLQTPALYDPSAAAGSRWTRTGFGSSVLARMYHSSATLLPDGSVFVAGSSPNADFIGTTAAGVSVNATDPYWTTYAAEKWYPSYYNKARPVLSATPTLNIPYGGQLDKITLKAGSLASNTSVATTKVVLIRTGFSTHSMNMGMRHVELKTTVAASTDGSATVYAAGVPSANTLAPGPALLFVVVDGVPSIGVMVMVGNGKIGAQTVAAAVTLPASTGSPSVSKAAASSSVAAGAAGASSTSGSSSSATKNSGATHNVVVGAFAGLFAAIAVVLVVAA